MIKKGTFICGFRKCGTTTLFDILSTHGDFDIPKFKEPQFFCLSHQTILTNINWYKKLYPNTDNILDGSTLYCQYPQSLTRIKEHVDNPKFLICLRDPAKRMFSAFWHMKCQLQKPEKRTFLETLESLKHVHTQFEEEQLLQQLNKEKRISLDYLGPQYHRTRFNCNFDTTGISKFSFFLYLSESNYSEHLKNLEHSYLPIFLEDLLKNTEATLYKVQKHLNIHLEGAVLPNNKNKTRKKIPLFHWGKRAPAGIKNFFRSLQSATPNMTEDEYNCARNLLEDEYNYWIPRNPHLSNLWKYTY